MIVAELALYQLAKLFSRTEVAHDSKMKSAMAAQHSCEQYRSAEVARVLDALKRFGLSLASRDVLDLGCNDGALTVQYMSERPRSIVGVDVDSGAIQRAQGRPPIAGLEYRLSTTQTLPVDSSSIDLIVCYDVFEHVSKPDEVLQECRRVLRPGGQMLIGTWGWFHPFAPHLWAAMPVPWAHVFVSERTLLRACRRVYHASWYVPIYHDFDVNGRRYQDRYTEDAIPTDYLNKLLVKDFERVFANSGLVTNVVLHPFGSRYASWTKPFLQVPFVREFVHGYLWASLSKPEF